MSTPSTTPAPFQPGDVVTHDGTPGTWRVTAVDGNRLTVTNPHTHGGRTYLAADRCQAAHRNIDPRKCRRCSTVIPSGVFCDPCLDEAAR